MAPLDRPRHNRALRAAPRTEMADLATILCIDDDRETLEVRQRVLRSAGYDVLTAQGGRAGLDVISSGARVNLVVLDYMMPGMNGDEVVEYVKAALPQIPIIAVSAVRLPPNMLRTVDAYVQKGQDVEVLLSAIAQVLAAGAPQASEGGCKRKSTSWPRGRWSSNRRDSRYWWPATALKLSKRFAPNQWMRWFSIISCLA
jgi:CheY-like chemotaxis protein